jgi:hypothetical protein
MHSSGLHVLQVAEYIRANGISQVERYHQTDAEYKKTGGLASSE